MNFSNTAADCDGSEEVEYFHILRRRTLRRIRDAQSYFVTEQPDTDK